ncbi:MAG: insulinase family protein, partial [Butyricicoccus sp.]|nr:insulinase family protein [Butyricicoccus sp.]
YRDYGEAEDALPVKPRFRRAMEVSAPQFIIGAKLDAEKGGNALLRQKLVSSLALNCLFGQSSPFYNRLYRDGLLNTDFSSGMDYCAGTLTVMAGGESCEPERVFTELCAELERAAGGLDEALFSRTLKSSYGSRIRALSSFAGLCSSMAEAEFGGYNCMDSFAVMESVTAAETLEFIRGQLRPERFAMSVIDPVGRGEPV